MKTIAYYALHYGSEYLAWSVRSIQHCVDEIHFLYTDKPSFGVATTLVCPDTEERLIQEAHRFVAPGQHDKLFWHRVKAHGEGHHRDQLRTLAKDAQIVVHVDADEVWDEHALMSAIAATRGTSHWSLRARFLHFWRSFKWVCTDAAMPERFFNWQNSKHLGAGYLSPFLQPVPVLHFGYAQSEALMRYKWQIHGHQAELRPGWFETQFLGWHPGDGDVHPTCRDGFWTPRETSDDERAILHNVLGDHPYFDLPIIR